MLGVFLVICLHVSLCCAMLCISAAYAVVRRLSGVCHVRVLCGNGYWVRIGNRTQGFEWYRTIFSDVE